MEINTARRALKFIYSTINFDLKKWRLWVLTSEERKSWNRWHPPLHNAKQWIVGVLCARRAEYVSVCYNQFNSLKSVPGCSETAARIECWSYKCNFKILKKLSNIPIRMWCSESDCPFIKNSGWIFLHNWGISVCPPQSVKTICHIDFKLGRCLTDDPTAHMSVIVEVWTREVSEINKKPVDNGSFSCSSRNHENRRHHSARSICYICYLRLLYDPVLFTGWRLHKAA